MNTLGGDAEFVELLTRERRIDRPVLAGDFNYEVTTPNKELSQVAA
jgi:hypothetical protein